MEKKCDNIKSVISIASDAWEGADLSASFPQVDLEKYGLISNKEIPAEIRRLYSCYEVMQSQSSFGSSKSEKKCLVHRCDLMRGLFHDALAVFLELPPEEYFDESDLIIIGPDKLAYMEVDRFAALFGHMGKLYAID